MADNSAVFERFIFCCRERAYGFGKQFELVDMKRCLACLRAEHYPLRLNKIANVEHLVEKIQTLFSYLVGAKEQLNFARAVFNVREGDLAHGAAGADASCQRDP